jgi:membrane protease YdiL (CAAX protease family)
MLFRGVLQGALQHALGLAAGLLLASALFGLLHFITLTYAVFATVLGAYLGWLWMVTDNLLVPTVAHAAYDFAALLYLLRWERRAPANK